MLSLIASISRLSVTKNGAIVFFRKSSAGGRVGQGKFSVRAKNIVDAEFHEATRGNLAGRADGAVPEDEV
jgi:hypothetical protein